MSCKVQQSVCSDCVTYVKSRIKFNTFNTFNNVKLRNLGRKSVWTILDFVEENNLDFKEDGESDVDFYTRLNNRLSVK